FNGLNIGFHTFKYDSQGGTVARPVLAYSADGGGSKGNFVGRRIDRRCDHFTFGGDSDYQGASNGPKSLSRNFMDKFPRVPVSFEFGNHERDVEGSKTGNTDQIEYIARELPLQSEGRFVTHDVKDGIAAPFVDIFEDQSRYNKPFIILHIDSDILPCNPSYQKEVRDLINQFQGQYSQKCDIVISLHHAPETYNARRTKNSDAKKYLGHLAKIGVITEKEKQEKLEGLSEWRVDPSKPNAVASGVWNQMVSDSLKDIYKQVRKQNEGQLRVIATQSGHDHFAHVSVQKNQPISIMQGNGSQEGFNNPFQQIGLGKSQHISSKYARSGQRKGKLFGVDQYRRQDDAAYLRLGYGEWSWNELGEPVYTQLRFPSSTPSDDGRLIPNTKTVFHEDGSLDIYDYVNHEHCRVTQKKIDSQQKSQFDVDEEEQGTRYINKSEFVETLKGRKVAKILVPRIRDLRKLAEKAITGYSSVNGSGGDPGRDLLAQAEALGSLSALLEGLIYLKPPREYQSVVINACHSGQITIQEALKLNRLAYGLNQLKTMDSGRFDKIVYDEYNQEKGRRRKVFDTATETISQLRKIPKIEGRIYKKDVEFVLKLRDKRSYLCINPLQRRGTNKNSETLFKNQLEANDERHSATEKAIGKLGVAFG
ncbi:hypothetical protein, partial [Piscirickettsia litoralis]|uniref:hypothetical protein n=1 Tax=Piscirickettsia litoralis TaxID=1891921 RepID=UPI001300CEEA